jgi:hypothetical protein
MTRVVSDLLPVHSLDRSVVFHVARQGYRKHVNITISCSFELRPRENYMLKKDVEFDHGYKTYGILRIQNWNLHFSDLD